MLLTYFLNDFEIDPVAPIIIGIAFVFILLLLLFLFWGTNSSLSSMDINGLGDPTRNLREFSLLHFPITRCSTTAESACSGFDVFRRKITTFSHILYLL